MNPVFAIAGVSLALTLAVLPFTRRSLMSGTVAYREDFDEPIDLHEIGIRTVKYHQQPEQSERPEATHEEHATTRRLEPINATVIYGQRSVNNNNGAVEAHIPAIDGERHEAQTVVENTSPDTTLDEEPRNAEPADHEGENVETGDMEERNWLLRLAQRFLPARKRVTHIDQSVLLPSYMTPAMPEPQAVDAPSIEPASAVAAPDPVDTDPLPVPAWARVSSPIDAKPQEVPAPQSSHQDDASHDEIIEPGHATVSQPTATIERQDATIETQGETHVTGLTIFPEPPLANQVTPTPTSVAPEEAPTSLAWLVALGIPVIPPASLRRRFATTVANELDDPLRDDKLRRIIAEDPDKSVVDIAFHALHKRTA